MHIESDVSWRRTALALAGLLALSAVAAAQTTTPAPPPAATAASAIEPEAMAALDKMGAYLRTLDAFQVKAVTSTDEVLTDGQLATFSATADMLVDRPNKLRAEVNGDLRQRLYLYDGKSFTLWAKRLKMYATVPAAPTLGEVARNLADKYGVEMPLGDLFLWGQDPAQAQAITAATDLGPAEVVGVSCEHYAFRQEGLDWQVWIQRGAFPLPRRLVLSTTDDEARPRHTALFDWNLAPSFNDDAFTFVAPKDAVKIDFAQASANGAGQ
jgi:hypothetical protein